MRMQYLVDTFPHFSIMGSNIQLHPEKGAKTAIVWPPVESAIPNEPQTAKKTWEV